ncbi:hypothetical protein ES703_122939 [subsurface metagenome]
MCPSTANQGSEIQVTLQAAAQLTLHNISRSTSLKSLISPIAFGGRSLEGSEFEAIFQGEC